MQLVGAPGIWVNPPPLELRSPPPSVGKEGSVHAMLGPLITL